MYAHSLVVTLNMLQFELSLQMELRHKWIHVSDGCTKFREGSYQSPSGWESLHTEENLHQMGQCLPRKGKEYNHFCFSVNELYIQG